jgi:hypothetical protein
MQIGQNTPNSSIIHAEWSLHITNKRLLTWQYSVEKGVEFQQLLQMQQLEA